MMKKINLEPKNDGWETEGDVIIDSSPTDERGDLTPAVMFDVAASYKTVDPKSVSTNISLDKAEEIGNALIDAARQARDAIRTCAYTVWTNHPIESEPERATKFICPLETKGKTFEDAAFKRMEWLSDIQRNNTVLLLVEKDGVSKHFLGVREDGVPKVYPLDMSKREY